MYTWYSIYSLKPLCEKRINVSIKEIITLRQPKVIQLISIRPKFQTQIFSILRAFFRLTIIIYYHNIYIIYINIPYICYIYNVYIYTQIIDYTSRAWIHSSFPHLYLTSILHLTLFWISILNISSYSLRKSPVALAF